MFAFTSILAVAFLLPLVTALQLGTPTSVISAGQITITWTAAAGDPSVFSIQLVTEAFHNSFAIANNVNSNLGTLTVALPNVPAGDGYTLQAFDISNVNMVYATSGTFSIASLSSASTPSSASSTTGSASSTSVLSTVTTASTTIGTTTKTNTTGTATNTPGAAPTFNSLPYLRCAPIGAIILSVIGGAAVFMF